MTTQHAIQRALTWLIIGIVVSGIIAILTVPYAIGQYGLFGLWIPTVLLLPLILQAAAAFKLKHTVNPPR